MELVTKNTSDLIPYVNNSRTHSEEQINQIISSIKEFGFTNPVLIESDNGIIAGHGRIMAAKKMGLKEVPCVMVKGLTKTQIKALNIADNQIALNAGWDLDKLKLEIQGLNEDSFNLDTLGFSKNQIDDFLFEEKQGLTEDDATPEIDESEVKSKLGDIFILGDHRLLCDDSLKEESYKILFKNKIANICFTSPPYNAGSLNVEGNETTKEKYKTFNDNMSLGEYDEFININLTYLLNYSEEVFYNIGLVQNNKKSIFNLIHNFNDKFKDIIYWKKSSVAPHIQKGIINNMVEFILAFGDGKRKFKNPQFTQGSYYNVIEGKNASNNEFSKIHKATFPVYLPENIIKNFTSINSIILDCFGGTGTTLIASEKLNRICYMIELDTLYCDTIIQRWQNFTGKEAIHEQTGKRYNEL